MSRLKKNLFKIVSACICLVLLVSVPVSAKRKHFTKEEDGIILRLVQQYGANNWRKIATLLSKWRSENGMGGRSRYSVRDRYKYYLDPTLNRDPFSPEEDANLLAAFEKFGPRWRELSELFPNRRDCSIRNRCNRLLRNRFCDDRYSLVSELMNPEQQQPRQIQTTSCSENQFNLNDELLWMEWLEKMEDSDKKETDNKNLYLQGLG
jgi:hypothetical protein